MRCSHILSPAVNWPMALQTAPWEEIKIKTRGKSASLPSRNTQFSAGLRGLAGTRLMMFQISFLLISKTLKLKTVLSVKTQVWTQPVPWSIVSFLFLFSFLTQRSWAKSNFQSYYKLALKWRKTCSFDSWGVTLRGSLGTQYQWRSLFPLPWMQQYIKREKKRRLALFMIFLFNFCWKWNCVLLILQTNGGEVEAQKFLLGSPERGSVFVVWCGKSPVYLLHCPDIPEWFAVGSVGWIQFLCKRKWWSHSFGIKDSTGPSSVRCVSPDLHPPNFIRGWKKHKNSLWTWPKQGVQPESLAIQNARGQGGGEEEGAWKDMLEITGNVRGCC